MSGCEVPKWMAACSMPCNEPRCGEVKDKLGANGLSLSGGQQQRSASRVPSRCD